LDVFETIATKLDVREYSSKHVPDEIKRRILESARLTGSSMNTQHWRFILIQDKANLKKLASDSTTGQWVANADFGIVILVNPKIPGSGIDGGRVLQDMQLAAWGSGVASRLYTGFKEEEMRRDFAVPTDLKLEAVVGFGYPARKVIGRKNRKPVEELVFSEKYGNPLNLR
jgi:nitroreductase